MDANTGGAAMARRPLSQMSDEALNRKAERLLNANFNRMTYVQKRKNADAYMAVKAELAARGNR